MNDIVEQVKERNAIEDVVGEFFELGRKHGTKMRAVAHDSLVVDTAKQRYYWNSVNEDGDVIAFVQRRKNMEFKEAVEFLADRVGITVKWGGRDGAQALANRQREDVFALACQVWAGYLWGHPAALAYARGRGFDDETIRLAGLGYTGGTVRVRDMRGELTMANIDPECPAAVCLMGFQGDVGGWGLRYGVDLSEHGDWVTQGYIPGAMGRERVVYPHVQGGRVRYFTTRAILGGVQWDDKEDGSRKEVRKSWNPSKALAGPRQPFYNQVYDRQAQAVVVVEGPADAVTLGVWGYSAVALCGVSMKDAEGMGVLAERLKRHQVKYVALDGDAAGGESLREVAAVFGPLARLVRWPEDVGSGGEVAPVKFTLRTDEPEPDVLLGDAIAVAEESKGPDVSMALLQRKLHVGVARAGRLKEAVQAHYAKMGRQAVEAFDGADVGAAGGVVVAEPDELLADALAVADESGEGAEVKIGTVQVRLRIGYTRAARLVDAVRAVYAASAAAAGDDVSVDDGNGEGGDEH